MQYHPYANLFPMMPDAELAYIVEDMKANGYDPSMPVITYEGQILDGRNRFKAAELAGVEPSFVEYQGDDALAYVIRHNLHRRHLNESQRAVVAGRLATMTQADGARLTHEKLDRGDASANLRKHVSQQEAAEMLNVSRRTIQTIKAVEREAPQLIPLIEAGEITANEAVKEAKKIVKEHSMGEHVAQTKNVGDEWYTPKWLFDSLGLKFDIDVCSPVDTTYSNVPAKKRFNINDDGLAQKWEGTVWCNPPYSNSEPWANKMIDHGDGLLLTHIPMNALWAAQVWQQCNGLRLFQAMEFVRPDGSKERPGYWLMVAAFGDVAAKALQQLVTPDEVRENLRRVPSPYLKPIR